MTCKGIKGRGLNVSNHLTALVTSFGFDKIRGAAEGTDLSSLTPFIGAKDFE
jgi:hypothetical protein